MTPAGPGGDDTVRYPLGRRWRSVAWQRGVAAVTSAALLGAATTWLLWPQPAAPPMPVGAAASAVSASVAAAFTIETATESQIVAHTAPSLSIFRFADNPRILVLDFASLHEQGRMLNRIAAFVEKARQPHNRVLTDAELEAAIAQSGDSMDTYYFGHDYSAAVLAAFFARADDQRIELNVDEERLRALLRQEGWFAPAVAAGLISVPAASVASGVSPEARAAILRHELSHGEFFSNPAYAAYVHNFWQKEMTGGERGAVRNFLGRRDYDVREEELMFNEMQAYLMFTRSPQFFSADEAGFPPARLAELQARFLAGMPAGWLRDVLAGYQGDPSAP